MIFMNKYSKYFLIVAYFTCIYLRHDFTMINIFQNWRRLQSDADHNRQKSGLYYWPGKVDFFYERSNTSTNSLMWSGMVPSIFYLFNVPRFSNVIRNFLSWLLARNGSDFTDKRMDFRHDNSLNIMNDQAGGSPERTTLFLLCLKGEY